MLHSLLNRGPLIAMAVLLVTSYTTVAVSAVLAAPIVFGVALVVSTAVDLTIERRYPAVVALLRRAQFGISHRAFVQIFLLLLLVAITDANRSMSRMELLAITVVALAVPASRIGYMGLLTLARRRVLPPVEIRNLDLPPAYRPVSLPRVLDFEAGPRLVFVGVLPVLGGALSVHLNTFWPFFAVVLAYAVVVGVASAVLVRWLVRIDGRPSPAQQVDEVSRAVHALGAEVVLYFSGAEQSLYQVDMWLSTLSRMRQRCVLLVRERHAVQNLGRTGLPVVCIPSSVDLMNFALPDVRVAMYVANVGKNIHFLREPRVKHVFIGHGDSDKVGSFNPFSKVYDQIWVAGPGGRERYARARVGIRDDAIVEVGRPQLDMIERRAVPAASDPAQRFDRPLTVFYAPTWEGWTDDDFQTSLTEMGTLLVRRLLDAPVPVRLVYKPHPLTGTRDRRAGVANERVIAMISEAADAQGAVPADAAARLEELAERLSAGDISVEDEQALTEEWNAVFWPANAGRHVVVTDRLPTLFDCYNAADVLLTDVSSLVSDFLASGKPYVVANPKDVPDADFREAFPSVRGAYLLHPGCVDLDDILRDVSGDDPMAEARAEARTYLLGPDVPAAQARWNTAVDALVAAADEEWGGLHGAGPPVDQAGRIEHDRQPDPERVALIDTGTDG